METYPTRNSAAISIEDKGNRHNPNGSSHRGKSAEASGPKTCDIEKKIQRHDPNKELSGMYHKETKDNIAFNNGSSQRDGGKRVPSDIDRTNDINSSNHSKNDNSEGHRIKNSIDSNGHKGKKIKVNVKLKNSTFSGSQYNPYVVTGTSYEDSKHPSEVHLSQENGLVTKSSHDSAPCTTYSSGTSRVDGAKNYQRRNTCGFSGDRSSDVRWNTSHSGVSNSSNVDHSQFSNGSSSEINVATRYTVKSAENTFKTHVVFKQSPVAYGSRSQEGMGDFPPKENYRRLNPSGNNVRKNYYEMKNRMGHYRINTSDFSGKIYENVSGKSSYRYGNNVHRGNSRVNVHSNTRNNYSNQTVGNRVGNNNVNPLGIYWPKLKSDKGKAPTGVAERHKGYSEVHLLVEPKNNLDICDSNVEEKVVVNFVSSSCGVPATSSDCLQKSTEILKRTGSESPLTVNRAVPTTCSSHQRDPSFVSTEPKINPTLIKNTVSDSKVSSCNSNEMKNNVSLSTNTTVDNNPTDTINNSTLIQNKQTVNDTEMSGSNVSDVNVATATKTNDPDVNSVANDKKNPPNAKKNRRVKLNQKFDYKRKSKFKTYLIKLNLEDPFDEQAVHMIGQFEMTSREMVKVDQLVTDLTRVFSPLIPNVKPILFGSVVAGTAFRNSDVDVFLQCYDYLPEGNAKNFILHHGFMIQKGGLFRQVIKIANARVPILKAVHFSSGISVDVSFKTDSTESHYGHCNSVLVKHLCSHDLRVRNLIMLVLFWAKFHGFIGTYQISSFTFILLVIFYLQIVEILPPLHRVVQEKEGETCWPTSFNSDVNLLVNSNTESLESLYLGFFSFYSAVRFDEVVISVYAGELVLGVLFETSDLLPKCYSRYRQLVAAGNELPLSRSEMCIQEPFNLSWNTVRYASSRVVEMLKQASQNVCHVFAKLSSNRALSVIHSEFLSIEGDEDSYAWQLPCPSDLSPSEWFKKVIQASYTIFSSILLMVVNVDTQLPLGSKFCKFYFPDAGEDENPLQLNVSCEYFVTTKERNKFVKACHSLNLSEYEKQIKASSLYVEVLKKENKKFQFHAAVCIVMNEKNGSTEICVNKSRSFKWRKSEHRKFVSFLRNENFTNFLSLALELDPINVPKVDTDLSKTSS